MKVIKLHGYELDDDLAHQAMQLCHDAEVEYDKMDADDNVASFAGTRISFKKFKQMNKTTLFLLAVKCQHSLMSLVGIACMSKHCKDELILHDVYVVSSFRRRGVGNKLVKNAIKIAKQMKVSLMLNVNPLNDVAMKMYRDAGFKICKEQNVRMNINFKMK